MRNSQLDACFALKAILFHPVYLEIESSCWWRFEVLRNRHSPGDFVEHVCGVGRLVPVRVPLLHPLLVGRPDLLDGGPAVHAQHAVRLELGGDRQGDDEE